MFRSEVGRQEQTKELWVERLCRERGNREVETKQDFPLCYVA